MTQYNRRPSPQQRTATPRPAGAARQAAGSGRAPHASLRGAIPPWVRRMILFGAIGIVAAFFMQTLMPTGFPLKVKQASGDTASVQQLYASGSVRINEVSSSNTGAYVTRAGAAADWVEIINIGKSGVNLAGWSLAKSAGASVQFTFPNRTLAAGECLVVFCDGTAAIPDGEGELHAPFRLSAKGDTLMLFNNANTAVDSINIPALDSNVSYARTEGDSWERTRRSTPGEENTDEGYSRLTTVSKSSPIEITEIMSSNKTTVHAGDGGAFDYIELHNSSDAPVDLSGYWLSDSIDGKYAWQFPEGTKLDAGAYMLVFCSGLDKQDDGGYFHTSFRLSSGGESAVLTDPYGYPVSMVTFPALKADQAYSLAGGEWTSSASPTPGQANP